MDPQINYVSHNISGRILNRPNGLYGHQYDDRNCKNAITLTSKNLPQATPTGSLIAPLKPYFLKSVSSHFLFFQIFLKLPMCFLIQPYGSALHISSAITHCIQIFHSLCQMFYSLLHRLYLTSVEVQKKCRHYGHGYSPSRHWLLTVLSL